MFKVMDSTEGNKRGSLRPLEEERFLDCFQGSPSEWQWENYSFCG